MVFDGLRLLLGIPTELDREISRLRLEIIAQDIERNRPPPMGTCYYCMITRPLSELEPVPTRPGKLICKIDGDRFGLKRTA